MGSSEIEENLCRRSLAEAAPGFSVLLVQYIGEETNSCRRCCPHLRRLPTLPVWPEEEEDHRAQGLFHFLKQTKKKTSLLGLGSVSVQVRFRVGSS